MSAYKISRHSAKQRQHRRDYQTVFPIVGLVIIYLNRKIVRKRIPIIFRNTDIYFIRIIRILISPGINSLLQGVNIIHTVLIDKHSQTATYNRDIYGNYTGQSPLQ